MSANLPLSVHELCRALRDGQPYQEDRLDRVLWSDTSRGLIEVQSAVTWMALAARLRPGDLAIAGGRATRATVGESVARNAAGLDGTPAVQHIEALAMISPDGQLRRVSRLHHPELFTLAIGGHGLFGPVYSITLRLESLSRALVATPAPRLPRTGARPLQLLVPPEQLDAFMVDVRALCRQWRTGIGEPCLRIVHRDDETFLRWAPREYAEITLLLEKGGALGRAVRLAQVRRELIDLAIACGGSFPIACTPEATREQVLACYPQLEKFLAEQRRSDPTDRWANDWLRHHRGLLGREACEVRWAH